MTYIFLIIFIIFFSTLLIGNIIQFRFKVYLNEAFPELYNAKIGNISEGIWTGKAIRKRVAELVSDNTFLEKLDSKAKKQAKVCRFNSRLSLIAMISLFLMFPVSVFVHLFL